MLDQVPASIGGVQPLAGTAVRRRCAPESFSFATTDEIRDGPNVVGQERALAALDFGINVEHHGFNLFAFGPSGLGKFEVIRALLTRKAAGEPVPPDCCYVHNAKEPHKPVALMLPAGRGMAFRRAMDHFDEEVRAAILGVIESEDFRTRREAVEEEAKQKQQKAFETVEQEAERHGVALIRTPIGLMIAPIRDGKPITPKEFQQLPKEEQVALRQQTEALEKQLEEVLRQVPRWNAEAHGKIRKLVQDSATYAVSHMIEDLQRQFADLPQVLDYLAAVKGDVIEHVDEILAGRKADSDGESASAEARLFSRYKVNLLVDNSALTGAPVVFEDNPSFQNLLGRIEHMSRFGALVTDFTLIKAGALHRANGGYLLLDARRVLTQPFAWDELKRVLQARQIRIESVGQMLSLVSTVSLEPEPIPLEAKVVLIGEPLIYYLLGELDPDFRELFKVPVDFSDEMDWTDENLQHFASWIGGLARHKKLPPIDRTGMARLVEHASRMAEDAGKLSLHRLPLLDLLREAHHVAGRAGSASIGGDHIQQAIDAQIWRNDRVRERVYESIRRGTMRIELSGTQVGQVNGLSVARVGGFSFGWPTRISARTRVGRGRVVDIEREVKLGGPIHSKGVLILEGFLSARYAGDLPLSLSASLVFEQSYGGVEGDSASSAELYALLSSLAELPVRQDLAVTGSVDQHGRIQAIGGVNEKVEGFFDVCRQAGLTGSQGVLIPRANVQHLMLRHDVATAIEEGRFFVYAIETVDEGIALLTGVAAGERTGTAPFPAGTVNGKVDERLRAFAAVTKSFVALQGKAATE
jgi:lon-related putative ATP-dependent protease